MFLNSRALRFVLGAASVGLLSSCGGSDSGPSAPKLVLTTLNVSLATNSVIVGGSTSAGASGVDQNGSPIATGSVIWATGTPGVATVNGSGQIMTVGVGTTTIVASVGAIQGSASLTVIPIPVATVNVTPATATVIIGKTQQLAAATLDAGGAILTGRTITWVSADSTKATVSAAGLLTAASAGTVNVTATSEGKSGTTAITVIPPPVATVNVSPVTATVTVGKTQQLTAVTLDAGGATLTGRTVIWASADTTKATVSAAGLVTAVAAGAVSVTATSEGKSGSAAMTVIPIPVATVTVTPATATLNPGGTQQYTATALSATGATLTGRTVAWTSSDQTKATVSALGLVTAVAIGTSTITATSEGVSGSATVTITAPSPVATVTVVPLTSTIVIGGTTTLTATPRDASGNVLTGRVFTWTSTNLTIVSGAFQGGVLTANGIGAGTATLTATSEGRSGSATITVVASPPAITSVSPSTLVPGASMTIVGSGFASTTSGNVVRVGTATATVTSASTTQLVATVPCLNTGAVGVTVTANTLTSGSVNASVTPTVQTLGVGQTAQMLTEAAVRCNELPVTGGKYLISVFNSSTIPASNATVALTGTSASIASGGSFLVTPQIARLNGGTRRAMNRESAVDATRRANAVVHLSMLDQDRELYQRLHSSPSYAASLDAVRLHARMKSVVVPLTVGQTVTIHNRGLSGACTNSTTSAARVVAVNAHSIVLEDNASPTAGQVDADLIALGSTFENSQYAVLANFGDINTYDVAGGLDNAGKVVMFFTPTENVTASGGGIILGHVNTCDLYGSTVSGASGSNNTKIFYARVPTLMTGSATTTNTRAWWNSVMPGTLVHEAKHLVSFTERFARSANVLEESWLEEGTAQVSDDIWSRSVYAGTSWKGNTTYANSVTCDIHRGTTCPSGQSLMESHFNWLYTYYQNTDSKSFLSPGSTDGTIYGSAWLFTRWLVDQYGGATESTLLKALTKESALSGVNNVVNKTGAPFTTLLADFTMALIADDYPGFSAASGAKYTVPSWNIRSMWTGYAADLGMANPLSPVALSFGSFTVSGSLPGAGVGLIELSGTQTKKQLLDMSALPTGSTLRMSILRVQ